MILEKDNAIVADLLLTETMRDETSKKGKYYF